MEGLNSVPQEKKKETLDSSDLPHRENWFFDQLDNLPEELADKWEREYEDLENPENSDFFEKFGDFLARRENLLINGLTFAPETPSSVVKEIVSLGKDIIDEYEKPKSFLGEGRTAKVHVHPKSPDVCIKYIKDVELYTKTDIPLYQEYERLKELQDLNFKGVRTPTPYFENTNGRHIYGMERIKGNTLVQILEKPEENEDLIKLSQMLDREMILENVVNFVKIMHEKYKITHNDLEIINLMLGYDGNLYIIDFGKSKVEDFGEDHELYRDGDVRTVTLAVKEFFERVDNISIF